MYLQDLNFTITIYRAMINLIDYLWKLFLMIFIIYLFQYNFIIILYQEYQDDPLVT